MLRSGRPWWDGMYNSNPERTQAAINELESLRYLISWPDATMTEVRTLIDSRVEDLKTDLQKHKKVLA